MSKPQLTNLSLLTFGLFAAGNCQLPRIAAKLPLLTGAASLTQPLPVLFVAVAYRGRALPLAWRMLPAMGCSEFSEQKALLTEVAALVPPSVEVTLLADRAYGSVAMTRWCLSRGWHFCLRVTPIKP